MWFRWRELACWDEPGCWSKVNPIEKEISAGSFLPIEDNYYHPHKIMSRSCFYSLHLTAASFKVASTFSNNSLTCVWVTANTCTHRVRCLGVEQFQRKSKNSDMYASYKSGWILHDLREIKFLLLPIYINSYYSHHFATKQFYNFTYYIWPC